MPVEASIPLSGIAPKIPSAGEMISLQATMEQMRERKQMADMRQAEGASEKVTEGLAAGLSAYYGAPDGTPEEQRVRLMRDAQNKFFTDIGRSGKAGMWGWNQAKINELATHQIAPDQALNLISTSAKYKEFVENIRAKKFGQIAAGPATTSAAAPAQPGQPQIAPMPQDPDVIGPPAPVDVAAATPHIGPENMPDVYQENQVGIQGSMPRAPAETEDSLRRKAQERDDIARQLRLAGDTKGGNEAAKQASDYRQDADRLTGKNQDERKIELEGKKLDETVKDRESRLELENRKLAETVKNRNEIEQNRLFQQGATKKQQALHLDDNFRQEPAVKEYRVIQPLLEAMRNAAGSKSSAASVDMIYAICKIFDYNSVVKEGEQIQIVNAGGLPSQLQSLIGYVNGKGRLSEQLKKGLLDQAGSRADINRQSYEAVKESYISQAKRWDLNPDDIVRDYETKARGVPSMSSMPPMKPERQTEFNSAPAKPIEWNASKERRMQELLEKDNAAQ